MTIAQALHQFWSSFGWAAYDVNTVPSSDLNPQMPRITYDVEWSEFDDTKQLEASLWDRSYSWQTVEEKAEEIANYIGGGMILPDKKGRVYFLDAQRVSDEDDALRRIIIQVQVDFYRPI